MNSHIDALIADIESKTTRESILDAYKKAQKHESVKGEEDLQVLCKSYDRAIKNLKHSAIIGINRVSSFRPYIVFGELRGLVSQHRFATAAFGRMLRDHGRCKRYGGCSDSQVYRWDGTNWQVLESATEKP